MSTSTRSACLASWSAHQRRASVSGKLELNAASAAGMILMVHAGDVAAAIADARSRIEVAGYWIRVSWTLEQIKLEEEAAEALSRTAAE